MAHRDLIEQYLEELRAGLAGRPNAAEIIDEVNDHLRSHVERLSPGMTDAEAQQQALQRLGDPRVVAAMFHRNERPDRFGDQARAVFGAAGCVAAACWFTGALAPYLFPGGDGFMGGTWSAAIISSAVFLVGVNWRSGRVQPIWVAGSVGAVLLAVLMVADFSFNVSYGAAVVIAAGVFTAVRCGRRRPGEFWASLTVALATPVAVAIDIYVLNPAGLPQQPIVAAVYGLAVLALARLYRRRQSADALDQQIRVPS